MTNFEVIDPTALAELKKGRTTGNQMKAENRAILTAFDGLNEGQAFPAPLPADEADAAKYAKRVKNFLTTQGRKDRDVFVSASNPKQIVIERTAKKAA